MKPNELIAKIENGELDKNFKKIYVSDSAVEEQKPRYIRTIKEFINLFGDDRDVFVLSAPGRTEVCGNHTDHNNGKGLAASINLDAIAIAAKRDDMKINEKSEGHGLNEVDISTLSSDEAEYGRSSSMIKGVAAGLKEKGYEIGGFDACTTSDVMGGSGLSSSAAFEVLIATVINHLYNDGKIDAVTVAKAMGKNVLREVEYEEFFQSLDVLKEKVNDRALLRAFHFFGENERVDKAVSSLENNDFDSFKQAITESGYSSFLYNQNVYSPKNPTEQKLSLALCISEKLLNGKGAWRVHGGGFAGTIQAFVPNDMLDAYKETINRVFGDGSCHVLIIRPVGGARVID